MTIDEIRKKKLILLECISGSRAYGLDTPTSDTDIKGVYLLPKKQFYAFEKETQISNSSNDIVFYELRRFLELLSVNNPNIIELLNTPKHALLYRHPILDQIDNERVLSKLCMNTFGKFAISQIKKARGLKKKIVNPVAKERKSPLSFCFVAYEKGSIPLTKFLEIKGIRQEDCGLVNINHMNDVYGLYHSKSIHYKGIISSPKANDVSLSSIPKQEQQIGLMYFNRNGYSTYCKEYNEYWSWVEKRNEARYQNTKSHGKNYDAKNMMHVFRLLEMAIEIGKYKQVNVRRPNREFLLKIKSGEFEYDDLLKMADDKQEEMVEAFKNSDLRTKPDLAYLNELAFELRDELYGNH
jgi:hypothetical protein